MFTKDYSKTDLGTVKGNSTTAMATTTKVSLRMTFHMDQMDNTHALMGLSIKENFIRGLDTGVER